MKNVFLTLILGLVFTVGAYAQKMVALVDFATADTIDNVLEGQIWKIDNNAGDSTAVVSYVKANGDISTVNADTNEAEFLTRTNRLITPSGLGYSINADRILSAKRVSNSSCIVIYEWGNGDRRAIDLSISVTALLAVVNAL